MSMDLVSLEATSVGATRPPPESGEAPDGKRLKSEPKRPPWESKRPPWESKRLEDLEESDFSMYDDHPIPYIFVHMSFVYKNKAAIKREEVTALYREQCRNISPYDRIAYPPAISGICGGISPVHITDDVRPRLIRFCHLALNKYNADNQGTNFVFDDLVKSTNSVVGGRLYYITFNAKDAAHPSTNNTAVLTFQAKVWDKILPTDAEPVVCSCSMKPT